MWWHLKFPRYISNFFRDFGSQSFDVKKSFYEIQVFELVFRNLHLLKWILIGIGWDPFVQRKLLFWYITEAFMTYWCKNTIFFHKRFDFWDYLKFLIKEETDDISFHSKTCSSRVVYFTWHSRLLGNKSIMIFYISRVYRTSHSRLHLLTECVWWKVTGTFYKC